MIDTASDTDTVIEKTPAQVFTAISYDGELAKPSKVAQVFYAKVREMRRDPTIKLVRQFVIAPLVGGKWTVECKDDAPEGAKEFVEEQIEKHRLDLITKSMCGMLDFGWQAFERIVEDLHGKHEGMWGIRWLKPLLQDISIIMVDPNDGSFVGIRQEPLSIVSTMAQMASQINLSADQVVLMNAEVEGTNWYGEPVMKALECLYDEQAQISKSARKYDARIAGSHWVVKYPLGTSKYKGVDIDNGDLAQELIRGIEAMGGIALPASAVQMLDSLNAELSKDASTQWDIDLLSDKGAGQAPFLDRYKYIDILKVRAFGYPERALLEGQFGTKAESEAHADLAIMNLEMKHSQLTQQVNTQFVNWLLFVNYGPDSKDSVYVTPAPLADRAIAFLREIYKIMVALPEGAANEMQVVDWKVIRDKVGIKEIEMPMDEYGFPIVEQIDPITGMPMIEGAPVTDMGLIPEPAPEPMYGFARDHDGKFGDGGRTLEQQRDFEHRAKMQKLKAELEGSKTTIEIGGRQRKLVVKEVRTTVEAGRKKVAYTHTGEAYDLDGNHVASVVRFPAGNWKEG